MKLPFFYPQHPEFKAHVEYVTKELWRFYQDADDLKLPYKVAEKRAKEIVLWVGSRKVAWWELLLDRLQGRANEPVDDRFEQGLERWLRDAIERAEAKNDRWIASGAYTTQADATAGLKTLIFRELGLDDTKPEG